jgi:hypothetical protein
MINAAVIIATLTSNAAVAHQRVRLTPHFGRD